MRADSTATVRGWFTTRHGGVSRTPYDTNNLATHVGDDAADVAANRAGLAEAADAPVVWMQQVHGARVTVVAASGDSDSDVADTDALVTTTPGLALAVLVADCVPVLLSDAAAGIVAVAHAGRRGLVAEVVPRTLAVMADLGAREVTAVLGPSICGRCYEVPAALHDEVVASVPASAATTARGTPGLDIAAGVRAQLTGCVEVSDVGVCTFESPNHFSFRRDGVTGRTAGVILLPT